MFVVCASYHNTRIWGFKVEVSDVQENTVMFSNLDDPRALSVSSVAIGVIWRVNLSSGSLENPTTTCVGNPIQS